LGSQVKEPSLQLPLIELPQRERERERERRSVSRALFNYLSKFTVNGPPPLLMFPNGDPMERDTRFQSLLLNISR